MGREKIAIVSAVPETILAFMSKHLQALSREYSTYAVCSNASNIPVQRLIPDVQYIDISMNEKFLPLGMLFPYFN